MGLGLAARSARAGLTSGANAPTPAFVSQLGNLVDNPGAYPDVVFEVEEGSRRIHGHRAILAARCAPFAAMFASGMRESAREAVVSLPDTPGEPFVALLHFLYTDTLPSGVSPEDAVAVYALADQFTLDRLKLLCERRVARSITVDNAAALLAACDAVEPSLPQPANAAGAAPAAGGTTTYSGAPRAGTPKTPGGATGSLGIAASGQRAGSGSGSIASPQLPPLPSASSGSGGGGVSGGVSEPSSLKAHVMDFVLANFDAVIKTPAFRDLSRDLILDVLARK
jgi:hypothetical protein